MPPKKEEKNKEEKKKDKKKKVLDKNRKLGMGGTIGIVDKPNKCIEKASPQPECKPSIPHPAPSCCQARKFLPQDCSSTRESFRPNDC